MEEIIHIIPGINSNNSRILVIEYSVQLEEVLSETIGLLLDINWKTSKSLGFESGALTYNQKVLLLQDKRNTSSEMNKKLKAFMEIRNKFAHLKVIDSFENYFKLSKNSQDNKKLTNGILSQIQSMTISKKNISGCFLICTMIFLCIYLRSTWSIQFKHFQ